MTEPLQLLTLQDVIKRINLQKSWVYLAIQRGAFPAPVRLPGTRRTLFDARAIDAWISDRIAGVPAP